MTHLCLLFFLMAVGAFPSPKAASTKLSSEDAKKIRDLEDAYTAAWVSNDREAVLRTLGGDAVLMPSGLAPITGTHAIEKFWWPDDGSQTIITSYTTDIDEIGGNADVAFVRGAGHLRFTYEKDGKKTEHASDSVYLMIAQKQADGEWLITHRMWGSLK